MSLYAIKNDEGEWLSFDSSHESVWGTNNPTFFKDKIYAEAQSMGRKAHVVELTEYPVKVVVSEEEAEMLRQAKGSLNPALTIYAHCKTIIGPSAENRLMRAYVIGWTVAKPKRYVLPMDGTKLTDGTAGYAALNSEHTWTIYGFDSQKSVVLYGHTVTQADIDAAPAWVKAIKPVEVTDDEQ